MIRFVIFIGAPCGTGLWLLFAWAAHRVIQGLV
jgi:hypothetical protein